MKPLITHSLVAFPLILLALYQSGYRIAYLGDTPAGERPHHVIVTAAR